MINGNSLHSRLWQFIFSVGFLSATDKDFQGSTWSPMELLASKQFRAVQPYVAPTCLLDILAEQRGI